MPATLRLTSSGVNAVGGGWIPSKDLIARIANPNVKRAAVSTQEMNINDTLNTTDVGERVSTFVSTLAYFES